MFYLDFYPDNPHPDNLPSFRRLSTSKDWCPWLTSAIPAGIHSDVKSRLTSNLKHIMVGLEMKAGLIVPHGERVSGRSVLFEPYFQILNFEFSVGVFSVCEGLGSVHHLAKIGDDGAKGKRIKPDEWIGALCHEFGETHQKELKENVDQVKKVRDKMHQDKLGARAHIDWHDFDYKKSFIPSRAALQTLLRKHLGNVPKQTNLMLT